ncbi:MAG: hypothetical protein ACRD3T_15440 [Terriglobia bacterium]
MIFDALWKAHRERRKCNKLYRRLIENAEREKNSEEVETLCLEAMHERDVINEKINLLESSRIQEEAERLGIPIPKYSLDSEAWEKGLRNDKVYLSLKAKGELRSQIRREKRERIEYWTLIVKDLVVPLMGLLGVITGLVSVIH